MQCYGEASNGNLSNAYDFAKQAMQSAGLVSKSGEKCFKFFFLHSEVAFFDPSILELLYFPDDQK